MKEKEKEKEAEKEKEKEKTTKALSIRFPGPILKQMKEIAKQHNRSLNGEILTAIEEHIKKNKKANRE